MFRVFCVLLALAGISRADLSEEFEYEIRLDDRNDTEPIFTMYWTYNNATSNQSTVSFAVHVKTLGWIGFGFANKINEMKDYDVVMGYIDKQTGKRSVKDCHTIGHERPIIDTQQDLLNTSVAQEHVYTTIVFTRQVDTKDEKDIPIKPGPMIVVWSYSNTDNTRIKHVERGHKIVTLIPKTIPMQAAPRSPSNACRASQGMMLLVSCVGLLWSYWTSL